jgi:hypothetical protein
MGKYTLWCKISLLKERVSSSYEIKRSSRHPCICNLLLDNCHSYIYWYAFPNNWSDFCYLCLLPSKILPQSSLCSFQFLLEIVFLN